MSSALPAGVGAALVTVFDPAGEVDAKATADLAAQLAETGLVSFLVAGTTGEAGSLSLKERADLVRAVRAALPAGVAVLAGAGAPSTRQAVEITTAVCDAGADAVLALSPPGSADPRPYYEALAKTAGSTPLLAYHYPFASAPGIGVDTLAGLPVAGIKDSSGDIGRLYDELETFPGAIYTGAHSLTLVAGALGCAGALLAVANVYPELAIKAFGGDGAAQRALVVAGSALTKERLTSLKIGVAQRFGTSATVRMG
jgi:4-hydroxy-tetrahydrodipicolinate synthase